MYELYYFLEGLETVDTLQLTCGRKSLYHGLFNTETNGAAISILCDFDISIRVRRPWPHL